MVSVYEARWLTGIQTEFMDIEGLLWRNGLLSKYEAATCAKTRKRNRVGEQKSDTSPHKTSDSLKHVADEGHPFGFEVERALEERALEEREGQFRILFSRSGAHTSEMGSLGSKGRGSNWERCKQVQKNWGEDNREQTGSRPLLGERKK